MDKLILLDDELTSSWARVVMKELRASGRYSVTATARASEFLDLIEEEVPSIAIVDWELHGVALGGADDDGVSGETGIDVVAAMLTDYFERRRSRH